jgi:hypothetical protein
MDWNFMVPIFRCETWVTIANRFRCSPASSSPSTARAPPQWLVSEFACGLKLMTRLPQPRAVGEAIVQQLAQPRHEPSLSEVLDGGVTRLMMDADGVRREDVEAVMFASGKKRQRTAKRSRRTVKRSSRRRTR